METTDYCSYELSKALKACGFDEPCIAQWSCEPDGKPMLVGSTAFVFSNAELKGRDVTAPLLFHARKWLREKCGIVVIAEPDWDSEDYCMADYLTGEWYFSVWKDGDRVHCNFDPNAEEERIWMFEKYEQALSSGIASALELIKKGE